jgi:hypothetical protein
MIAFHIWNFGAVLGDDVNWGDQSDDGEVKIIFSLVGTGSNTCTVVLKIVEGEENRT